MKKIILPILLLVILQLSCKEDGITPPPKNNPPGWQDDIPWPSLDANPWPIHHGDAQFTGRSKYAGPQLGQVEWMIELPTTNLTHDSFLSPVVGDSTIYFVSYKDTASPGSFLYALRFDGSIKWTFPLPSPTQKNSSPPILASDGTIYVATWGDKLYAVTKDGNLKWELNIPPLGIKSIMNLDREGNLYAFSSSGVLYKISLSGNIVWTLTLDDFGSSSSAVVFSPDGNTMFITGKKLFVVSTDGILRWTYSEGSNLSLWSTTPLVDSKGNIFMDSGLLKIDSERRYTTRFVDITSPPSIIDPTIDRNGNLYIGLDNELLSIDYSGNVRWRRPYDLNDFFSILSDMEDMIYILTAENVLIKLDSLANEIWRIQLDGYSYYSMSISSKGKIYLGTVRGTKKYFYSIK